MVLKITVCFFFQKQKNNHEFKGDRDDEGIILFWNIHREGESCRESCCVFNERGEYRATIQGDWWT